MTAGTSGSEGAILSSAVKHPGPILAAVVSDKADPKIRSAMIGPVVTTATAARNAEAITKLVDSLPKPAQGEPIPSWWLSLAAELFGSGSAELGDLGSSPFMRSVFAHARLVAQDEKGQGSDRRTALRLLGHEPEQRDGDIALLTTLLEPRNDAAIQLAAVQALAKLRGSEGATRLIAAWPQMPPPRARRQSMGCWLARAPRRLCSRRLRISRSPRRKSTPLIANGCSTRRIRH